MDRMLYVAMTGAKQLMQAQALVSHNLANVSTTGFRADLARFEARPVGLKRSHVRRRHSCL